MRRSAKWSHAEHDPIDMSFLFLFANNKRRRFRNMRIVYSFNVKRLINRQTQKQSHSNATFKKNDTFI